MKPKIFFLCPILCSIFLSQLKEAYAQSHQQYIIDIWKNVPIIQPRLFLFSGITDINELSVLQRQHAGIYYRSSYTNLLLHYIQEGDQWLSERAFTVTYQYRTRKTSHQFTLGILGRYKVRQFYEQPIENQIQQDIQVMYRWKEMSYYQMTTQWKNGIHLLGTRLQFGLRITDKIIAELIQGYHLNLNQYVAHLKIEYQLSHFLSLQFLQRINLWSSKISIILSYKRFQLMSEMKWHQYLGVGANSFIFYAIL